RVEAVFRNVTAIQLGEWGEALRRPSDDRKFKPHAIFCSADGRVRRAADRNPGGQTVRVIGRGEDRVVFEGCALSPGPGDRLFATEMVEEVEFFVEQDFVIGQIVAEQREGFDKGAAAQRDLSAASGDTVQRGEALVDA